MKEKKVKKVEKKYAKPLSVVQIEEHSNGYVITYPNPADEGYIADVFETKEGLSDNPGSNEDCKKARDLIFNIINALGLSGYYFDIECHGKYDYTSEEKS
ncbi:MAG: hypothetical protein A2452_10130 [Candidatus Firestonebacteria bacterium RIFOXYC2_FULL_39_67]|nr:MAG: hypothetical protein A2536_06500 [Candidatus Firestonebacteria bacterium RIFOXYD2_FULL_39_29]OGF54261.1 MAG: hypothetical protein A2452_10130 [Candidatus Firestonebacteria bacterium RIFOXYC2_FULL_39_67]OGF56893.1 MAG: hypothetical protein A2497_06090 [Candidatus Firestonebacteria bacterium RifOxyC12_full_39_7]